MSHNPLKRARLNPGAYRDLLPLPSEASSRPVEAREVQLVCVGGAQTVLQPPPICTTHTEQDSSWANLQTWEPIDDTNYALDPEDGEWYDEAVGQDITEQPRRPVVPTKKKYTRSRVQKRPHVVWKDLHRQRYLEEQMRWEGRGDFMSAQCPDCRARHVESLHPAAYRCVECFLLDLVCKTCCVKRHKTNPFHRIEVCAAVNHFSST